MKAIQRTILCIDSSRDTCELMTALFTDRGFEVATARAGDEGLELLMTRKYSAVILGFYLPGRNGPSLCRKFREFDERTPVVFYTRAASASERDEGFAAGAQAYLTKPDDLSRLVSTVEALIEPVAAPITPPETETPGGTAKAAYD